MIDRCFTCWEVERRNFTLYLGQVENLPGGTPRLAGTDLVGDVQVCGRTQEFKGGGFKAVRQFIASKSG